MSHSLVDFIKKKKKKKKKKISEQTLIKHRKRQIFN
jgi:hypothetical protein